MKIILTEDVEKLGKMGDVVEVKKGYARNFLFPQNLAMVANDRALKVLEIKKKKREQQLAKEKKDMETLAEKISTLSCTVSMVAGEEDKLFGAVKAEHISEALAAEGVNIDKKNIIITEPIKKLGVYMVEVKLHPEVTTTTKLWVVKK